MQFLKARIPKIKFNFNFFSNLAKVFKFRKKGKGLYKIWKQFLQKIPPLFRRSISSYENFFLVLGYPQSGKSTLIKKCIESQQHVFPFDTTYTLDPALQCYVGSKYAVQEISWTFVEDTGIETRKELIYMWERLYSHRDPIVIVVFNPFFWKGLDSEKCKHHARQFLSKMSLLSSIVNQPVRVRIAMTHMDQLDGYSDLAQILQSQGLPSEISLTHYDKQTLKNILDGYEEFLSLLLKNSSADGYLKILNFFKTFPTLFPCLDYFLRGLLQKDSEKKVLILESLVFTSNNETDLPDTLFKCKQQVTSSMFIRKHILKHQFVCLCLALIGLVYFFSIYLLDRKSLDSVKIAITTLERHQTFSVLDEVILSLEPLTHKRFCDQYLAFLPSFFHSPYLKLTRDFISYSRDYVLFPKLRKTLMENGSEIKTIYLLGLMYASKDNRIGELILENVEEWTSVLGLPEQFVRFYVQLSTDKNPFSLDTISDFYLHSCLTDYKPWIQCLDGIQKVIENPDSVSIFLEEIKDKASSLIQTLQVFKQYSLTPFICKLLIEEEIPGLRKIFSKRIEVIQFLKENGEMLEEFFQTINNLSLEIVSCHDMNFLQFVNQIKETIISHGESKSYHFLIPGKVFLIDSRALTDLISRHKVHQLMKDYMDQNREPDGKIFFKNASALFDLSFFYLEEDFPLFKGKKAIPGCYTYTAYEKYIYHIVNPLVQINGSPLIDFELKNQFNRFVSQNLESYAKQYRKSYQDLFYLFDGCYNSLEEIKKNLILIGEISSSHFTHFFNSLKYNLNLPSNDSLILYPMHHLNDFQFLSTILSEELDKQSLLVDYQRILIQLLRDLRNESSPEEGEYLLLDKYLSPAGRLSLSILQQKENSYFSQVMRWLEKANIPTRYHSFFLNPIVRLHEMGLKELKFSVESCWISDFYPLLKMFYSYFPFSPSSSSIATPEMVESILHPLQGIWEKIQQSIGLVCSEKNGQWSSIYSSLVFDHSICAQLNALSSLRDQFWNCEGKRQPLLLRLKTVPFKENLEKDKSMLLSYLVAGDEFLFNINQQPRWTTFSFAWWEQKTAHVGVELLDPKTKKRIYQNLKIENAFWSFFLLLAKAKQKDEHTWTWDVSEKLLKQKRCECSFQFEKNPWKILSNYNFGEE